MTAKKEESMTPSDSIPESESTKANAKSDKNSEKLGWGEKWGEMMKEVTLTGLAAVFMTEDSVRSFLKERMVPKELINALLDNMGKRKEDFYALLATEFGRVLNKIDLSQEITKFMEKHKVNVSISFERKDDNP